MAGVPQVFERNQEATLYVGNVDQKIDDEVLWELMVQAGPVSSVHLPKDKITHQHMGYGFVEYRNEEDADYAIKILNMVKLFGKPIRLNKSSRDKRSNDVGANLFVGNLCEEVDEKTLYDTFASFGVLLFAKIMRDESNVSKGFGFISYDGFDAGDAALANMNGQFMANRPISVSYAYKKDSRGERHGSAAERLLADHRPDSQAASLAKSQGDALLKHRQETRQQEKGNPNDIPVNPIRESSSTPSNQPRPPSMAPSPHAMTKAGTPVRPPSGMPPRPPLGVPRMPSRPTMSQRPPLGMPMPPGAGGRDPIRPPSNVPARPPLGMPTPPNMRRDGGGMDMPMPPMPPVPPTMPMPPGFPGMPMPPGGLPLPRFNPMQGVVRPSMIPMGGGPPRPPK